MSADYQQVLLGFMSGTVENVSFSLSPVPKPNTWAMLAAAR